MVAGSGSSSPAWQAGGAGGGRERVVGRRDGLAGMVTSNRVGAEQRRQKLRRSRATPAEIASEQSNASRHRVGAEQRQQKFDEVMSAGYASDLRKRWTAAQLDGSRKVWVAPHLSRYEAPSPPLTLSVTHKLCVARSRAPTRSPTQSV
eukprot:127858-Chlamydomonas_euryale.AAC.1